jgi:WD40 repeat protein
VTRPAAETFVPRARPISPYKGLAPFEDSELDERLFFGRERERKVIAANLVASRLTILYGPSGVGKSSVLRAGVARDLRALPERPAVVVFDSWADDPLTALELAIADSAGVEPTGSIVDTIALVAALKGELYLVLDQLEEYFLYHGGERGPGTLDETLPEIVNRAELAVHVLIGAREDALARLDAFKRRIPNLFANSLRLERLDREAGRRAILGPVERFGELVSEEEGLAIEDALVAGVLDGVRAGELVPGTRGRGATKRKQSPRIETPYLQLVMQRLWEVERAEGSRVLRLSTLERLGGASKIVEEHLERALEALTPGQKAMAARMFDHLVTPSGTKIAHDAQDLAQYAAATEQELDPVLNTLGRERILRSVSVGDGGAHEIYHDVLADAVLAWRSRFEAEQTLARERADAARRHRRLLGLVGVTLVALAAMTAITVYALAQRSDARRQAALAQRGQTRAEAATRRAKLAQADANKQRRVAKRQTAVAKESARKESQAAERARAAQLQADASAQTAIRESAAAEASRAEAVQGKAAAVAAKQSAQRAARSAEQQRRAAVKAKGREQQQRLSAQRATNRALAQELEARSEAALTTDPQRSLQYALDAYKRVPATSGLESTLRRALLIARELRILRLGAPVTTASFSPDSSRVAATTKKGGVRFFDAGTGRLQRSVDAGSQVDDSAFSPDGRTFATAGKDGRALLWDADSGLLLHALPHGGPVTSVSFSSDGRLVLTTSVDTTTTVWDAATGIQLQRFDEANRVDDASFNQDGSSVLTVARDHQALVFDVASGRQLRSFEHNALTSAAFSPDGTLVATGGRDDRARIWDLSTGALRYTLSGHGSDVNNVVFSRNGELLLTTSEDDTGREWNVKTGVFQATLFGHTAPVVDGAISADSRWLVTASKDGTARVWQADGSLAAVLLAHTGPLNSAAFSPDGRLVVTASDDGTARLWDAQLDPSLAVLGHHDGRVNSVAFSPDGSSLASAGVDGMVRFWNVRSRTAGRTCVACVPVNCGGCSTVGLLFAAAGTHAPAL